MDGKECNSCKLQQVCVDGDFSRQFIANCTNIPANWLSCGYVLLHWPYWTAKYYTNVRQWDCRKVWPFASRRHIKRAGHQLERFYLSKCCAPRNDCCCECLLLKKIMMSSLCINVSIYSMLSFPVVMFVFYSRSSRITRRPCRPACCGDTASNRTHSFPTVGSLRLQLHVLLHVVTDQHFLFGSSLLRSFIPKKN